MSTIMELDKEHVLNTYNRLNVTLVKGKGSLLYDENEKKYIDLGSGIAVNTFGLADETWQAAINSQLGKLQHVSNYYYTKPQAELAGLLCERTGMKGVFFSNSGAEANECAIKCARKYANDKYPEKRQNIITLKNSFHGRTIATLSATGQEEYHKFFMPFTPGFIHLPPNDIQAFEARASEGDCGGVMLELIQGEGGVMPLTIEYVTAVSDYCKKNDMILIIDEVQTGNGRTGSLYCYTQYGIEPDIVTTAKGIGGGLPIGATLFNEKTKNVLGKGSHGSTFGGNPICAAGALSILNRIDDALLAEVKEKSQWIKTELMSHPGVTNVTGLGLMLGIECIRPASDVLTGCLNKGVLVLSAKTKVRLLPALNIPFALLREGIYILEEELNV